TVWALGTGHTSWQMSQPNSQSPSNGRNSRGIGPRCSIVWNDRQRRLSSTYGPVMAPVGQAAPHRVQPPQLLRSGLSDSSAAVVITSPSSTQEPTPGSRRFVLLPVQP